MGNPLRAIADVKKEESSVVILLFLFFFLVIAVFQALYGLKKGLFVEFYGAEIELYAKLVNIVFAAVGFTVFTYLCSRFSRQTMVQVICLFFVSCLVPLAVALREPADWSIWSFYLVVDLVTTMLVAGFWVYATDLCSLDQAKRLFGVVGGGGIVGGVIGSGMTYFLLEDVGMRGLILFSALMMAAIVLVSSTLERILPRSGVFQKPRARLLTAVKHGPRESSMSALFDGVKEVVHSPFLAAIVGLVAFYEMASQVMDYQLSYMLEGLSGVYATQAWFADIRFYTNVLSVFVQFLLVSFVMRRFGLIAALLVLPLGIAGFSGAFLLMPTLFVVGNMNIFQNGLNYSLQQTARESLWVSTTPEEGKARPFTNIFVQRTAKGLSIGLVMALQMLRLDIQYLSVITVLSAAAMILCSVFAGRVLQRKAR